MRVSLFPAIIAATMIGGCASSPDHSYDTPETTVDDEFSRNADQPPKAKTLYALSRLLSSQGRAVEGHYVFLRAIKEFPNYIPAYNGLAEFYMRRGQVGDALSTLHAAQRRSPDDAVVLNNIGMCHVLKGEHDTALLNFTKAVDRAPRVQKYVANKAVALGMLGRYDEALDVYKSFLSESVAHLNVAMICEARNDHERASIEYAVARRKKHQEDRGS